MEGCRALGTQCGSLETDYIGEDRFVEIDFQVVLVAVASVVASSGFWAFVMRKTDSKSATTRLLMGLAYDRLMVKGEQ